ncbi:MAG: hypothetical protein WD073_03385 [Xanthobacteraceae bacterium]
MRKILLLAALTTSLGVPAAKAEDLTAQLSLSPKDPKYNSPACRSMREKARNYKGGILQQSPEAYVFAAVAPGGTVGFLALQHRKRELFKAKVEKACMTKPPDRSYLDPAGSAKEN